MSKYINVTKGIMNRYKLQDNTEQNCHSECLVEHYVRRCLDYLGQIFKVWVYENKDRFRRYKTDKRDR